MGDIQTSFNKIGQSCNHKTSGGSNGAACAHRAKTESDYFKWIVKNIK